MEQEIINKEVWKWEYFPEKDLRKMKVKSDGIITSIMLSFIKFLIPEVAFNMDGIYKVGFKLCNC